LNITDTGEIVLGGLIDSLKNFAVYLRPRRIEIVGVFAEDSLEGHT